MFNIFPLMVKLLDSDDHDPVSTAARRITFTIYYSVLSTSRSEQSAHFPEESTFQCRFTDNQIACFTSSISSRADVNILNNGFTSIGIFLKKSAMLLNHLFE